VVCADRHEVLAAAQAASYLHIPLIHMQGGEKTGSIDDKVRDAITHLADWHCVCTKLAAMRVYALTGAMDNVIVTGCPSIDLAAQAVTDPPVTFEELGGVWHDGYTSKDIDAPRPSRPTQIIMFHPVTNEVEQAARQMRVVLNACARTHFNRILFWPGEDAGHDAMSKVIREFTKLHWNDAWHVVRNLPPRRFLRLLTQAAVLVGNSSAFIREASYLGVPVVNVGTRQQGRERGPNAVDAEGTLAQPLLLKIQQQAAHGPYQSSSLYGKGDSGERIASVICERVGHRASKVG
jgi:UDP-hydrolysing UDP-N-acetyl-D-glucosamine 2-epimerase